ncbi:hypothetical protein ACLB1M_07395 [Escherichia coli]
MAHQHLQLTQRNATLQAAGKSDSFSAIQMPGCAATKVNAGSLCLLQLGEIGRCQSTPADFQPLLAGRL